MKVSEIHRNKYSESLTDLLIATLFSARSTKLFRKILSDRKFKRYKQESIQVAISRIKKQGYITKTEKSWSLTEKGKAKHRETQFFGYIPNPFNKESPVNTIISFDIPEKDRVVRNWLRNQIKIFDYKMLQQSLWIGPGPLPSDFFKRLDHLNIRKNIKTFKINKNTYK
jgi:DNA-binding transcriptional regulator PaaX